MTMSYFRPKLSILHDEHYQDLSKTFFWSAVFVFTPVRLPHVYVPTKGVTAVHSSADSFHVCTHAHLNDHLATIRNYYSRSLN